MKIRTYLVMGTGMGIGYVLGTRAGRARFEELKSRAERFVHDPEVRQKVADLPDQVRENLPKAQAAVNDAVKAAAGKVHKSGDAHGSPSQSTTVPASGPLPGAGGDAMAGSLTDPLAEAEAMPVTDLGDVAPGTASDVTPGTTDRKPGQTPL